MYYVYILASRRKGTLYTGVTNDLKKRAWQHRQDLVSGFTRRYGVHRLVHYTATESVESASQFEKRLKRWRRGWKLSLIESSNPDWRDLYDEIDLGPG